MNIEFLEFVNAAKFFPQYLPHHRNWRNKMRGKNGRGNPIQFTDREKQEIRDALRKMIEDIKSKP